MLFVNGADAGTDFLAEDALQRDAVGRDDHHVEPSLLQRCGGLETDEAGADHDGALGGGRELDETFGVAPRAQVVDLLVGHRQQARLRARGENQGIVRQAFVGFDDDVLRDGVDRRDDGAEPQLDALLVVVLARVQRQPLGGSVPGQVILREIGLVVRQLGLPADHHDAATVALGAKRVGGKRAGRAHADDDHGFGTLRRRRGRSGLELPADKVPVVAPLHLPPRQRRQRRRTQDRTGAEVETGMVPGAADRPVHERPLGQRSTVMRARSRDRVHVVADARQEDLILAEVTGDHLAVAEVIDENAVAQVPVSHVVSSCIDDAL